MKLYGCTNSSSTRRVRIALALKDVPYVPITIDVSRDTSDQLRPGFHRLNPERQIPVLEWTENGSMRRLAQSVAILEWLEERYPSPALLPSDSFLRARTRQMVQVVNAGIQPLQNNRTLAGIRALGADEASWAKNHISQGLRALDDLAQSTAGAFLVGDDVTMADVFSVPQMHNARNYGVDTTAFATLTRAEAHCIAIPAFSQV